MDVINVTFKAFFMVSYFPAFLYFVGSFDSLDFFYVTTRMREAFTYG